MEIEQTQQDANVVESSEATEPQSTVEGLEQNAPAETKDSDASTPFHEHPRFKELVEQKNQALEQAKALEQRYAQMEEQIKKLQTSGLTPKQQEDALISRLKGIDPEFGERFEKLDATQKELAELRQWRQEFEQRQTRTSAVSTINQLHEQNKLPENLRELYNEQLELAYAKAPQDFLRDIGTSYRKVHERMTKFMDSVRRTDRESYVSAKKADAAAPSASKGKSVSTSKDFKFSDNPEEARAQIVKRTMELMKAEKDQ